jgi:hypothetical protein
MRHQAICCHRASAQSFRLDSESHSLRCHSYRVYKDVIDGNINLISRQERVNSVGVGKDSSRERKQAKHKKIFRSTRHGVPFRLWSIGICALWGRGHMRPRWGGRGHLIRVGIHSLANCTNAPGRRVLYFRSRARQCAALQLKTSADEQKSTKLQSKLCNSIAIVFVNVINNLHNFDGTIYAIFCTYFRKSSTFVL